LPPPFVGVSFAVSALSNKSDSLCSSQKASAQLRQPLDLASYVTEILALELRLPSNSC